jgi:hypothetical protein
MSPLSAKPTNEFEHLAARHAPAPGSLAHSGQSSSNGSAE